MRHVGFRLLFTFEQVDEIFTEDSWINNDKMIAINERNET